jgi:hypothetical protein
MTLITCIWSIKYAIIAADSREVHNNQGTYQDNDSFNKILKYPELGIGFSGDSRLVNSESVIEFIKSTYHKYQDNKNLPDFFNEIDSLIEFHEKPNTDLSPRFYK